jgi:hypothetical protein
VVARVDSAWVVIIASLVGEDTSRGGSARVISACIVVVTSNGNVAARSVFAVARVVGTSVAIITNNGYDDGTVSS